MIATANHAPRAIAARKYASLTIVPFAPGRGPKTGEHQIEQHEHREDERDQHPWYLAPSGANAAATSVAPIPRTPTTA